jgi:hypothetical protein
MRQKRAKATEASNADQPRLMYPTNCYLVRHRFRFIPQGLGPCSTGRLAVPLLSSD